jgi:hypothetical protein
MKKILFLFVMGISGIMYAQAQTRVVVTAPAKRVVVAHRPAVVLRPVRRLVVRPAVTVVRPVARRRAVVVYH